MPPTRNRLKDTAYYQQVYSSFNRKRTKDCLTLEARTPQLQPKLGGVFRLAEVSSSDLNMEEIDFNERFFEESEYYHQNYSPDEVGVVVGLEAESSSMNEGESVENYDHANDSRSLGTIPEEQRT